MKKLVASLALAGTATAMFWFNIIPWAKQYCPTDSKGNLVPYTVTRTNDYGEVVTLTFGKEATKESANAQVKLCKMVFAE